MFHIFFYFIVFQNFCGNYNNQKAPIVEKAFQDAYRNWNAPFGLLFHSDQGSQYTAYSFRKLLRSLKVTRSFSASGCPYDNAVAEAFFRTIKAEAITRQQYKSEQELRDSVAKYIDFFNNRRPHPKFSYRTPSQVESDYYEV